MTALGIYLSVSLLFVIAAMVELFIIIYIERRTELRSELKVVPYQNISGSKARSAKLDTLSLGFLLTCYMIFNIVYWSYYLF